jgi:hypothetical protein
MAAELDLLIVVKWVAPWAEYLAEKMVHLMADLKA